MDAGLLQFQVIVPHFLRAAQQIGKDRIALIVGGIQRLMVRFQHDLAAVVYLSEVLQELLPVHRTVTGEQMQILIRTIEDIQKEWGL